MAKPRLLYISINDGSDTRINKEIRTLARDFDIDYVGIGQDDTRAFARQYCRSFELVRGRHKNPLVFLKYGFRVLKTYYFRRFDSFHLINENLLLVFLPFLFWRRRKLVLDVFDSIFLRSGRRLGWLRNLCYQVPKRIIVTDDNRKSLVPARFHAKTIVVENFPYRFTGKLDKTSQPDELVIFYNGSMSRSRGTDLLHQLLETDSRVRVKMAGWIYDEPTRQLAQHPRVEFLGVLTQQQSTELAAQCDYILSLYEPINENNINASPNKIYDAIQVGTPVIINREVKIAAFVEENQLGYVLESFYAEDYPKLVESLVYRKKNYLFSEKLRVRFTWESVEDKLVDAHLKPNP